MALTTILSTAKSTAEFLGVPAGLLAGLLAMAGVDAFTITALLGHKTLSMTARYTHPSDAHKRKAVEALGNFAQDCQKNVTIDFSSRTKHGVLR